MQLLSVTFSTDSAEYQLLTKPPRTTAAFEGRVYMLYAAPHLSE